MPDAAEAALARRYFCLQHRTGAVTRQEIDVTDNAGADGGRTIAAACAHRRRAIGEFNLADGTKRFRSLCAVHRARLDIDGCDDVVARGDIGGEVVEKVALAATVPQMMMGIDNGPRRV